MVPAERPPRLYHEPGALFAVTFDLRSLDISSAPVAVLDGIRVNSTFSLPAVAISASGTLAYQPGGANAARTVIVQVDRTGREEVFVAKRIFALLYSADTAGAIAAVNEAMTTFGRHPLFLQCLPRAYLNHGDARRADAAYTELRARSETDTVPRSALAIAASALGHTDDAIQCALESVERGDALNPTWARLPFATDAIRAHPRYPELLRAMCP